MTLTAVLFAGGRSSRMGTDKALLEIDGKPLWSRQLAVLRQVRPQALCLSAQVKPPWCPLGIQTFVDAAPSSGPMSGLVAALRGMDTSHLLALAIDLPRMTVEPLKELWQSAKLGVGVVPENDGCFEPLSAIYPREAAGFAETALKAGDLSLQNLMARLHLEKLVCLHPVSAAEQHFFLNLNSPVDLQKLRSSVSV